MKQKLSPQQTVSYISTYLHNIEEAKRSTIAVGIQDSELHYYTNEDGSVGESVQEVGAQHEFGTDKVPRRSFLRTPFWVKRTDLGKFITKQFVKVAETGFSASDAMELIGVKAQSISQEAFTNGGFGTWRALSQMTIEEKGSSQILVDTGALVQSITYKVY